MDTDGRQIIINIIFLIISISLIINSRFNILKTYMICNNMILERMIVLLNKEGYCIKNKYKYVYLIYPALYGDKECD